ncbi:MAG: prepilin-type N-terminal cleavage/methylation domain-containing protein [Planctomycetota bacterium]|jgi:type II secretion system protein I|nr:prepilin-type N-terminal cleavage/methylation domain-containing protein [Planctomycetota bacterium]
MNERGMTLLEVMMALAVFALAAAILLPMPRQYLADTGHARDQRIAWTLAAQKMSEIELDASIFRGQGDGSSGDFEEEGHPSFLYEWTAERIEVDTVEEGDLETQPKEIFQVRLIVQRGAESSEGGLITLEAMFPVEVSGEEEAGP